MAGIVEKHLDRREWYADSQRAFACRFHRDDCFAGGIGLITFTGLKEPETVETPEGPLCIADRGIQWLELVPENGHFAVTAMFREGQLFQQYIDITLRNRVAENGDAVFDDLLLDVVILRDGTPRIVDREELEEALAGGIVTREQYELALRTAETVAEVFSRDRETIERKLQEYRELFTM